MSDNDIRDQLEGLFSDSVAGPERDRGKDPTPPEPEAAAVDRTEAETAEVARHEPIPVPQADLPGDYSAPLTLEARVSALASIQLRLIIGLILAAIVPLIIVGGWSLYTMQKANTQAVERGEAAIVELAEAAIHQDAVATARQVELYLSMHPEVDMADMAQLENNTDLAEIAVQPVGQTGYTAVFDDKGITHFHTNPAIVGMDMSTLAGEMPEFWGIFAASLDGSASDGYYDWKDADGQIRPKYMSIVSVGDTPLRVAATTYIDEFVQPVVETRSQLAEIQKTAIVQLLVILALVALVASVVGYVLGHRFSQPILQMAGAAARIAAGDLSPINLPERRDEIGLLAHTLDSMATELRETWAGLEQRMAERTQALELATQVGQRLSTVRDLDQLLAEAVELIQGSFDLYHVQVYLADPAGRNLALRASTGQAGAELLRRGHVLPIGPGSVNGAAAAQKQAVIVSDTSGSAAFKPNPLLPDTRSEMAVPLLLGERVVGVLDLQSARPGALNAGTLPAVEALAGQLAVAIDNARLFGEVAQARAEVEAQLSRRASTGWSEFLDGIQRGERMGYACEGGSVQPLAEPLTATPETHTLTTPIRVQGVAVGAIQIEAEAGRAWTQAEAELVESVAHQVAQQAESLRLLAQAEAYRAEAEAASRRMTREGWAEYLQSQAESAAGFVYDLHQVQPLESNGNGHSSPPALAQTLQVRGEPIGELAVDGVEALDDEAIQFLATVAERLSEHLENLRLFEETQTRRYELEERSQELEASQRVTFAANETDDPDELLELVVNLIRDQFNLYHAQVYLVDTPPDAEGGDRGGHAAVLRKSTGYAGRQLIQAGHHIPLDHEASLVVKAIRTGQPVVVDDVSQEPDFMPNPLLPDTRSELVLPLKAGGQVLGALDVQDRAVGRFTPRTVILFQTMAEQVAMNFESADLLKHTTEQAEALTRFATQLRAAAEVAERVSAILDPDQLMGEVVELLQSRFGLYHAHIYMLETPPSGAAQLAVRAGSGEVGKVLCERGHCIPLDAEKSLVARAARSRQMIYVDDTSLKSDFMPNPLLPQTRSEVALPLVVGDRVLGVLDVQDDQPGRFTESDLNVFGTLAGQVATALDNARLFEEQKRAEAAIRESERQYRELLTSLRDGFAVVSMDGRIVDCNAAFEQIVGYSLEELRQVTFSDLTPEKWQAMEGQILAEQALTRGYTDLYQKEYVRKDGSIVPVELAVYVVKDKEGNPAGFWGFIRDITERQQAEAALRESEAQQRLIFEASPTPTLVTQLDGTILYANPQVSRLFGLPLEELVSRGSPAMYYDPADRQGFLEALEREGRVRSYEVRFKKADSTLIWGLLSSEPITFGGQPALLNGIYDITDRKRAEEALQESQQMLRLVMDNVPQSIFWKDKDLVYLGCNREFAEDAALASPEEVVGKTDYDMPWVEQAELYRADDRRVMESGQPVLNYEEPQTTPTGDIIWLRTSKVPLRDAAGNVTAVLGMYEDITDRKRAEQERERFTTQLSTAADVAAQIGAILDPDQLLNTVIPLLKERFGLYYVHFYMLDEAAGQLALRAGYGEPGRIMLERGHTIPLDAERSLVARAARSKEIVLANDVTQEPSFLPNPLLPETRSEVAVPAIAGGAVLGVFDVQHNVPGYFTEADLDVFQTLTGQITTALQNASLFEEIQQAAERLREVDRLKSEFLANMSHELRTPLNSILGYTEVMLMGISGDLPEETLEDVHAIYDNGQHLLRLINDILDLAKIEAGRMALNIEEVEIAPLLEDVRTNNSGLLVNKPVEMIVEVQEGLPAIKADRVRISQVLNNLVSNAAKFTEQGRITMRAFGDDGEWVCLEVEDTGIGIQESDLESIFEQFRQADGSFKRRAEGTGLGLTITRHLVHMHGGTINVRSQVGAGSTFTVHLPVESRVVETISGSGNGNKV